MIFGTSEGPIEVEITQGIVAGWTGRDRAAVDHHIAELAELGVSPPSQVPLFYPVSRSLFTQATEIDVLGPDTSGEIEPLLLNYRGRLWLGIGSDHTDRALETVSVAASKQCCPKPVGSELWPLADVSEHLDDIELHCEIVEDGRPVIYQTGQLSNIQPIDRLVTRVELSEGGAMLCGTIGAIGGVRPALSYRMSLHDPVLNRTLSLDYTVNVLPVVA